VPGLARSGADATSQTNTPLREAGSNPAPGIAIMATSPPRETNRESIQRCNRAVTEYFKVSLRVYKSLKMLVLLTAVATGIIAIRNGADPLTVYILIGIMVAGPEAVETVIANGNDE